MLPAASYSLSFALDQCNKQEGKWGKTGGDGNSNKVPLFIHKGTTRFAILTGYLCVARHI